MINKTISLGIETPVVNVINEIITIIIKTIKAFTFIPQIEGSFLKCL